jgi:uncharacterized protein
MKMNKALLATVFITFMALTGTGCNKSVPMANHATVTPEQEQAIGALRAAYAAFNRGDISAALVPFDTQIEWTEPTEFPGGGTYHGLAGVRGYLTQSRAAWAEGISEPEQFIPTGDRIVVFVHARVRIKDSRDWHDVFLADVYSFRNGKAVSMRAFADREEALRWVGLQNTGR